jgi:arabinan endo-1,5-alpha-L-arabinosidase
MPAGISRRHFLRSGLVMSAGLGLSVPILAHMQPETLDPSGLLEAEPGIPLELSGSVRRVHDPALIRGEDAYYLFSTGAGIPVRRSPDLLNWEISFPPNVFRRAPEWALELVPGAGDIWAPDISYFNDKYHLYYSVSTFGSNRSVIGLATNANLDPDSDEHEWIDEGLVVQTTGVEDYNAIDPNLVLDQDGVPWLAFGSHWGGIKMIRLDYDTGKASAEDDTLYSLAQRAVHPRAVEAPFIIRKDDFYYLFVSFDACCRGVDSTYRIMVGRSENVTGPYIDRDGVPMMEDGGTQVTFATERWRGPGASAVLQENGVEYLVYHAYDADSQGVFTLRIAPLEWDEEGWPSVSEDET